MQGVQYYLGGIHTGHLTRQFNVNVAYTDKLVLRERSH